MVTLARRRHVKSWVVPKFDHRDASLSLYLPLWHQYSDMTGTTIYSYDRTRTTITVTGATWGLDGRTFDGTDDWIDLINLISTFSTQNATILVRLKATSTTGGIVSSANTGATLTSYIRLGLSADKLQAVCLYKDVAKWTVTTDAVINSDLSSVLVGITHDGTAPVLYVNGVAPAQAFSVTADKTVWFGDMTDRLDYFGFGGYMLETGGVGTRLSATVSNILWHTRALSVTEISNISQATKRRD